jgi:hypothetical protein
MPRQGPTESRTAVGLLATQYLGAARNDQSVQESMDNVVENMQLQTNTTIALEGFN